ncbi:leucine--tRNA ligase [Flavihumibacter petaseus]|uniref:Leucine--tRNA ligase n=1 Tax=Flavihumibacter petaseus NBRC 106054 TaxID=1220578 RepID=A0A0E9N5G3_9BACT|nr:class I tRNA ligase family protein [Flavihumibacter petaseus]GAO45059.1 isoleucyl-tRNA synthetase [Flavihumibacter petaseus NBRC 106054]
MEYNFRRIEKEWQAAWQSAGAYQVSNDSSKPKAYVLDMFPYPSGAGLHVGHPLGYIASDIYSRFKRLKGFNVLHPMGYDAFGLPAEQYAIENGVHPAVSTEKNIATFRKQLDNIGFCYDWSREVRTSDPKYYRWTQWIFLQLFQSFFNRQKGKAEPLTELTAAFESEGNSSHPSPGNPSLQFSAADWKSYDNSRQQEILMDYRLAYCGYGEVNWCEALGTVLANDEVINGVSERGGFPVVKKKLRQWYLRITEYADRLLSGLEQIEFSDAMKEMQSNWIGKSFGAEMDFAVKSEQNLMKTLRVYTTRPDTIFGVDFMVVAPEMEWVPQLVAAAQSEAVETYLAYVKSRSDRERMAEKKITGVFTGAYAINPFDGREIPIWISEYVLAGYGTGAIMAVPCGDERDFKFARHFNIPVTNIIGDAFDGNEANPTKDAILENSGFLNGLQMRKAIDVVNDKVEALGIGRKKVNFKMRDAAFSRQRYWGEPFPVQWKSGVAVPLPESALPLELPYVESYKPGPDGEGPLANIPEWVARELETNTMPGYAGSSWYFLRYMDPHNDQEFCSRKASDYWNQVDLYIGGTEHAVGHLLYSRMWTKALYDLGHIGFDEPYRKLVNQGMIQGSSRFVYRVDSMGRNDDGSAGIVVNTSTPVFISGHYYQKFVSGEITGKELALLVNEQIAFFNLEENSDFSTITVTPIHVDVNIVDGYELDIEKFKKWRTEYQSAVFILEEGKYICGSLTEKMSKRLYNTVNPDDLVDKYGADTFRMYEMFLGPVEMSKPWDTKGIEGVHRFLKKFWRLFADEEKGLQVVDQPATPTELKVLHRTIRKIEEDTERFSFNTAVSTFMICTNELSDLKCRKKGILEQVLILLTPYAPHVCEELWKQIGNTGSILDAAFPVFEEQYVRESAKAYPVAINGKTRAEITISLDASQQDVESIIMADETVAKWLEGRAPKKVIYVKNKMINVVI